MNFLKLLFVLVFILMSSSAFSITHKENCDDNKVDTINVDINSLSLSSEFMDILKGFDWDQKVSGSKVELTNLTPDIVSFCNNYYDLLVARAPKSWKDPSVVTGSSAKKIAIQFNACLERGL